MEYHYTSELNTLILISLLKAHKIRYVIASPGTTNISFVASVQTDPYFKVFSVVDERAAGFMACGLAEESGEPVVLTCTGATASRNYIPGLTEAYYRNLPVLAVTSSQHYGRIGNNVAQVLDRSIQFHDLVKKSFQIYTINSEEDKNSTITTINDAILELRMGTDGPVHINLFTTYCNDFSVKKLPDFRVIKRITNNNFPIIPSGKIGIFVGAHSVFTDEETAAIDSFCESNNAVVICDQISNYRGKFRFLASFVNSQEKDLGTKIFDLIIYIGSIHGNYINFIGKECWRVNTDGIIRDPYYNLTYVFMMSELDFFRKYTKTIREDSLYKLVDNVQNNLRKKIPELPFSNMWIASQTSMDIPANSVLHLSILNTLRVWNYFETPKSVACYSNSGGYGIDGCLSSFIGSAYTNGKVEHFLVIGDLSFFYDVNALFNSIPSNVHIMLINNGVGTEFKNYNHRASMFKNDADPFIAAKGHNGNKNKNLVKDFCAERDILYIHASSKEEYKNNKKYWLEKNNQPIIFEIFTSDLNESKALELMNSVEKDHSLKSILKSSIVWKLAKKIIRG